MSQEQLLPSSLIIRPKHPANRNTKHKPTAFSLIKHNHSLSISKQIQRRQNQNQSRIDIKLINSESVASPLLSSDVKNVELTNQEIYLEHRQFLGRYRRERDGGNYGFRSNNQSEDRIVESGKRNRSFGKEQQNSGESSCRLSCSSQLQNRKIIKQKIGQIHHKITAQMESQNIYSPHGKFKIFRNIVETKSDVNRIIKQQRFIRSQQQKHCEYSEPQMMHNHSKLPKQMRMRTESAFDERELSIRARDFSQRIQRQQQNLWGKHIIVRKRQQSKKQKQELRRKKKLEFEKQLRKFQKYMKIQQSRELSKITYSIMKVELKKESDYATVQSKVGEYLKRKQESGIRKLVLPIIEQKSISKVNNGKIKEFIGEGKKNQKIDGSLRNKVASKRNKLPKPKLFENITDNNCAQPGENIKQLEQANAEETNIVMDEQISSLTERIPKIGHNLELIQKQIIDVGCQTDEMGHQQPAQKSIYKNKDRQHIKQQMINQN